VVVDYGTVEIVGVPQRLDGFDNPAHDKTESGRLNRVLTARLGCMNEWEPKFLTGLSRELKAEDA